MALTKEEKKVLVLPVLIALLIVGAGGYAWHLTARVTLMQEMIERTRLQIEENREHLHALKGFEQQEQFHHQYRLDEWIPMFDNKLAVGLFLTEKTQHVLDSVGAVQKNWKLTTPEASVNPFIAEFNLVAVFPSYEALVQFLRQMEETPPPLLPQEIEVVKTGIAGDLVTLGQQLVEEVFQLFGFLQDAFVDLVIDGFTAVAISFFQEGTGFLKGHLLAVDTNGHFGEDAAILLGFELHFRSERNIIITE